MFAAGMAPAVLFGLQFLAVPESPRWLVERQYEAEARGILGKVAGPVFAGSVTANIRASLAGEQGTWGAMFSRRLRLPLLVGRALAIRQQVTGIDLFLYCGATIFKRLSASTAVDAGLLQQILLNGASALAGVVASARVDRRGRRQFQPAFPF